MVAVGAFAVLSQNAQSQYGPLINTGNLYQNSTSFQNGNINLGNAQLGNEITLAGSATSDLITSFSYQYDFIGTAGGATPNGNETATVTFYQNNGPTYGATTYHEPGTPLFSDTVNIGLAGYTSGYTVDYFQADINGGLGVVVPEDFTWTVTFAGLTGSETAGLALYSPATVGGNYNDAWVNTGSGWTLDTTTAGTPPPDFGAVFNGPTSTVPDSSCLPLSVLAVMAGFGWMKRFQRQA